MVVALLSWYDEPAEWLGDLIATLHLADVTHLVAVDGAYGLYPNGKGRSRLDQHTTIHQSCHKHGIASTVHVPPIPWQGNEVAKRTFLFRLAEAVTEPTDWYLVVDADERIVEANEVAKTLSTSALDVGECMLHDPDELDQYRQRYRQFPMFFRAIRGLHCHLNHYTYRTPDGRNLWGNARTTRLEPRVRVSMTAEHRPKAKRRREQANAYYAHRDKVRAEMEVSGRA